MTWTTAEINTARRNAIRAMIHMARSYAVTATWRTGRTQTMYRELARMNLASARRVFARTGAVPL